MGEYMGVSRMKLLLVSALCLLSASPAWSTCLGSINVKDHGEVFIIAPDWAAGAISIQNNGFTMRGNSRLYFASRCENGWVSDMYAQLPLNNKHFAYTLDLSNVGCHCNAAAYFVKMPGNNAGDGDYYCDANLGNNIWCPEYDVMEGNKHTIACTLHTCNGGNGYWDSCDRGGRTPASTCATTGDTSATWPPATTGWSSPPVSGGVGASTWAGWTAWLDVVDSATLMA